MSLPVKLQLDYSERTILETLASRSYRRPSEMLRWLIRQEAERQGFFNEEQKIANMEQPPKADAVAKPEPIQMDEPELCSLDKAFAWADQMISESKMYTADSIARTHAAIAQAESLAQIAELFSLVVTDYGTSHHYIRTKPHD